MKPEYLLFSIIDYSIQISLLVGTAFLAAFLNRKKSPGTALWFWQAVLGLILLDPLPEHLLCMTQRLHQKCHFRISDEVSNPVTFGLLNPVILVPEKFLGLDQAQQECIACHELLHVSRRDWLLNLSEHLVKYLLWFHPAVHFLVREINLAREELVDARVVGITGKRQVYLKALWEMVQPGAGVNAFPVVPFAGRSQLLKRVRLLSKEGNVKEITIVESPNELLSQSAVEAVKQWKYAPVLQNGEPVEVIFTVTINYTLKD